MLPKGNLLPILTFSILVLSIIFPEFWLVDLTIIITFVPIIVPSVKRILTPLSKLPVDFLFSNPHRFWSDFDVDLFKSLHHHLQLSLDPSSSLVDEQSCPACVGTSLCPQVFVYLCGNLSMLEHHHRHHLSDRIIDCFCS